MGDDVRERHVALLQDRRGNVVDEDAGVSPGVKLAVVALVREPIAHVGEIRLAHGDDDRARRELVGVAGYLTLIAVFAVALGFVVRSTAGGIAVLFGLLLVLPGIGQVLPTSWQQHTLPYLPSNAGASIFSIHTDPGSLSAGAGLLTLGIWVAVTLGGAALLLTRRDA